VAMLPQVEETQLGLKPLVHAEGSQEETAAALSAVLSIIAKKGPSNIATPLTSSRSGFWVGAGM
jgi:hypothetical protein